MAYTTDGSVGVDLARADDEPQWKVGAVVVADDGTAYVYTENAGPPVTYTWVAGDDLTTA